MIFSKRLEWAEKAKAWCVKHAATTDAMGIITALQALGLFKEIDRPEIVVLCGSSKFVDIMAVCAWLIEKQENAITMSLHLLPWWYSTKEKIPDHLAEAEGVSDQMDELHLEKIDVGDTIFVVNQNDYIGDSTRREIEHAQKENKKIRWYTHDPIGRQVDELIDKAIKEGLTLTGRER